MKNCTMIVAILLLVLTFSVSTKAQGVLINEIVTNGNDYVEIVNLSASPVNLTGWTLQMTTDGAPTSSITFPGTTMIAAFEVIVISETQTQPSIPFNVQRFTVSNIFWIVNTGGACALNDANGVGQDLILFGNPTTLPTGAPLSPFSGSVPTGGTNTQDVFQRTSNVDTDTDVDWAMSATGTGSPGILNQGQSGIPSADFTVSAPVTITNSAIQFTDLSLGTPTSWQWDFDGDNVVDSTMQNPVFTYTALGSYDVTLTVTNGFGTDTLTQTAFVQVVIPPTIPFLDEFTNGTLHPAWSLTSTNNGIIFAGQPPSFSPASGGDALLFSATSSGSVYLNQATLFIDLSGVTGVEVRYQAREASDEPDANDGLFVSDGNQTLLAVSHQNLTNTWTEITFNLGAFALANGLNLNSSFQLIFSQQDNFPIATDGLIIDDVQVLVPPPADVGQANRVTSSMTIAGGLNLNGNPPDVGENGPFFVSSTQLDITISGMPFQPWILIAGPLNRNNHVFVPEGSLDIGTMGAVNDYSDLIVIIDGLNPVSLFDLFAVTGATVTGSLSVHLDNLPPGLLTTFQALVYQPSAPFVGITAAFEFTIF